METFDERVGEMNPDQLWDTTMNPETRKLIKISIPDKEEAEECISICMGDDVKARKAFIIESSEEEMLA